MDPAPPRPSVQARISPKSKSGSPGPWEVATGEQKGQVHFRGCGLDPQVLSPPSPRAPVLLLLSVVSKTPARVLRLLLISCRGSVLGLGSHEPSRPSGRPVPVQETCLFTSRGPWSGLSRSWLPPNLPGDPVLTWLGPCGSRRS